MTPTTFARAAAIVAAIVLGGCYTSHTAVLDADNSIRIGGMSEGLYCNAENKLLPPQVAVDPQISESLGANKCRDLHFDPATNRYVDERSASMEIRVGDMDMPLYLLQAQTSAGAPARMAPLAAVDGLFIQYDPQGRWPEGLVEKAGLELDDEGMVKETDPSYVQWVLYQAFDQDLERFRQDIAFVEDEDGPRLEFRSVDTAYSYIVYVKDDWRGDADRMRRAMLAIADKLGLAKLDHPFAKI